MNGPRLAAALLLTAWLGACATTSGPDLADRTASAGLPASALVAEVPFFPQEELYCGPAALAMVLAWSGLEVDADDLVPQVYTPGREGTLQHDIVAAARRNGRLAVEVRDMETLLAELAEGHPVLVFQNLALPAWPMWHYAVAIGYDAGADDIVLHSGTTPARRTGLAKFARTWARTDNWALLVLPPDRLPATADQRRVLEAASALERAGRNDAALTAYTAILGRWPESLPAWIGLGNAAYAQGDLRRATAAFRAATSRHPESTAAWRNLAHVLAETGDAEGAAAATAHADSLPTS